MTNVQAEFESWVSEAAERIHRALEQEAAQLYEKHGVDIQTGQRVVLTALRAMLDERLPTDARACVWRARLRLYDMTQNPDEPIADSDAERSAELPGATLLVSLPAVAKWVSDLASSHHCVPCIGLEASSLKRKLQSLRTQISQRGDGTGVWRLPYSVVEKAGLGSRDRYCIARVDVIRETEQS